jgi:alcohol dehydrogenase class IV
MNVRFLMPTQIVMGEDCIVNNGQLLKDLGKKAIIVTGKNSAKINGSLVDVVSTLTANGQEYVIFDDVMANPTIDCVYQGAAMARKERADFVIAIGGGSPMDAAKAISLLSCQDITRDKLFMGQYDDKVLPMAFIPTTAGTGSEVTQYSILTNDELKTKTSLATPILFPKVAFLDSKYTLSLSKTTTINTAVDALSHSMEGYLSSRANGISDILALESMQIIAKLFDKLKSFDLTKEDRDLLLYASTLGGMVIAHTGTTAVHAMGYSLTYFKDIDHGRANGLLIGEFLRLVQKVKAERVDNMMDKMGFVSLQEFINQLAELLGDKEELTLEEALEYAEKAMKTKNITNCIVTPTEADLLQIYKTVFRI